MSAIEVKICGLRTAEAVDAAVAPGDGPGADLVGFVFFERSPRYVTPGEAAVLAGRVPPAVVKVGLVVDPSDDDLAAITAGGVLDMLQLHGAETTDRVAEIKGRFGLPVMKALAVAGPGDVAAARAYEAVADRLLFDAKPPSGADRPGGNALPFDWSLLAGTDWAVPWLLAGGLTADNVAQAIAVSGAPGVDVSSGVEDAPGEKNLDKIRAFIRAAKEI